MNTKHLQTGALQLSPLFIILSVTAVAVFSYAMYNISHLPTPEEERKKFEMYAEQVNMAEEAQATGKTIAEIKHQRQESLNSFKLMNNLNKGIKEKNDILVSKALSQLDKENFSDTGAGGFVLSNAIKFNNQNALHLLLKKGISCHNNSFTGRAAFHAAIQSQNPDYIKILLDYSCNFESNSLQNSIEEEIINSQYPIKIFLLPEQYINPGDRDKAFFKAISKGMYEQVLTMLEMGADPNAISEERNALSMSIFAKNKKIAFLLMQKGADITAKPGRGRYPLVAAFMKGELEVAQEILRRDPDYIQRKKIETNILSNIYHFVKNPVELRDSLTFLLDNGTENAKLINSYDWLRKAILLQDSLLVDQLLEVGKDIYKPVAIQKALKFVQVKSINIYHKNKIITSLQNYSTE